ncbi:hypothetical protein M422DRAFT_272668 [Sphaerobolus stellatus SS14]|uniref:Uncharacterized protein n=1 Tax=Sphaerobolus stellatus (strain SS14) TaxID=990650 RepID=A0A0C9ULW6_SPHS4|nr:hypothetical protein M422DRAFT_272668 [Sphaerobolus stellatus SS14]
MTNNNEVTLLCQDLADLAKEAYPEYVDGARVYLTVGGAEGIEAAYHPALRYWDKSGVIGSSTPGYWKKKKLKSFCNSIDPPHELFFNKKNMKAGENVGQAAVKSFLLLYKVIVLTSALSTCTGERILEEGPESVTAFIFEPVQGDGGAVPHHPNLFPLAPEICDEYNTLKYGVSPDIMVISKALSSGYPRVRSFILIHNYTWSGQPTLCAVALKVLEIIERDNMILKLPNVVDPS